MFRCRHNTKTEAKVTMMDQPKRERRFRRSWILMANAKESRQRQLTTTKEQRVETVTLKITTAKSRGQSWWSHHGGAEEVLDKSTPPKIKRSKANVSIQKINAGRHQREDNGHLAAKEATWSAQGNKGGAQKASNKRRRRHKAVKAWCGRSQTASFRLKVIGDA